MQVKKNDCVHENVFAESNQHSIFLTDGRIQNYLS